MQNPRLWRQLGGRKQPKAKRVRGAHLQPKPRGSADRRGWKAPRPGWRPGPRLAVARPHGLVCLRPFRACASLRSLRRPRPRGGGHPPFKASPGFAGCLKGGCPLPPVGVGGRARPPRADRARWRALGSPLPSVGRRHRLAAPPSACCGATRMGPAGPPACGGSPRPRFTRRPPAPAAPAPQAGGTAAPLSPGPMRRARQSVPPGVPEIAGLPRSNQPRAGEVGRVSLVPAA